MSEVKKEIMIDGIKYKIMKIGIPVNSSTDIRFESSWYSKDPRRQEESK